MGITLALCWAICLASTVEVRFAIGHINSRKGEDIRQLLLPEVVPVLSVMGLVLDVPASSGR